MIEAKTKRKPIFSDSEIRCSNRTKVFSYQSSTIPKQTQKEENLEGYNGGSKCSCQRRETNGGGNPDYFLCVKKHAPSEQNVDFQQEQQHARHL